MLFHNCGKAFALNSHIINVVLYHMWGRFLTILLFLASGVNANGQQWASGNYHHPWSDSLLARMTLREQIAQTMMVAAWSNKDAAHTAEIEDLITRYHIGGIIFFQGTPLKQAYLTNYYQQLSPVPLMVGIDGEWGLAMRLQGMNKFPFQMTLGAAADSNLIYQSGLAMGKQCKRLGIHVNFAPDIDVNTNPDNPIIGFRSFGEDPVAVAQNGAAMMQGMQDAGIIACAKHFPGHGDSKADSHMELPRIDQDRARLDSVELLPFKHLFSQGVMSTMVGHLEIPSLDSAQHVPSSISHAITTDLLQKELGFKGLIFTDAMNMKGVTRYYEAGIAEAAALKAGNDILLFPSNVAIAIDIIEKQVREGLMDSIEISEHVRKILYFKMISGLNQYRPIDTRNLMDELGNRTADSLNALTAIKAITVVSDDNQVLPLKKHSIERVAVWEIGKEGKYVFADEVGKYQKSAVYFTHRDSSYEVFGKMSDSLSRYFDRVIISIHDQNLWGKKSQLIPQQVIQNIYFLSDRIPTTVVVFGNIYLLKNLPHQPNIIVAYEDGVAYQKSAAQVMFGEKPSIGKLPATAYQGYYLHQGIETYDHAPNFVIHGPLENGFKYDFSNNLDQLLEQTRNHKASPGGQVVVLKNGNPVYSRAWGSFYYDTLRPVKEDDMYDLASVTKVAATTLCIMKLYERGKIKLDDHIHNYLPELVGTNKEKITLRQLLLHEAGLPAWIPFYKEAMQKPGVFTVLADSIHTICVADRCWMDSSYAAILWQEIIDCPIEKRGEYVYSDLSMIIAAKIVERISGMNVAQFANKYFYQPMRLQRTLFNPATVYEISDIAPTTDDRYFRMQCIQGYVHDPAAAMMGGIAGNAGLFSNATELAAIFQMLLNQGEWKGTQYFKPTTVTEFTKRGHKKTHRALGFDMPNGFSGDKANISDMLPQSTFGHSGFTGNWVWADPDNDIVFVFLSNRTFPNEENRKLIQENIRTQAIEIVYKALE